MKKLKKMMTVCAFSLASSLIMSTSTQSTSQIWGVISSYANGWKQTSVCIAAEVATDAGIYYMLLGTGISGPAGAVVGIAATI